MKFYVILPNKELFPQPFLTLSEARTYSNDIVGSQVVSERHLNILQKQEQPSNSFIKRYWVGSNPLGLVSTVKPYAVPNKPLEYKPVSKIFKPPILYKKVEVIE